MRHYNIPIFIPHLGCPYDCIYCDQKKISAQLKAADNQEIIHIIEQHLQTIAYPAEVELAFFGGNFTSIPADLQETYLHLIQPYIKQGLIQGIRISTRPDCIDPVNLALLRKYGVKTIELGVQSLNDDVLQQSGRRYQAEAVEKSAALIHEWGFQLGIQLMVGLPGDNYERDLETVRRTIRIKPQMVRIYPTLVIAETQLDHLWQAGKYQALDLEEAIHICKDMLLQFMLADIPVIRMGLYPGEELRRDGVVKAGPFHPAFGELVEQAIFREQAILAIKLYHNRFGMAKSLAIYVHERDLSKLLGKKRSNLNLIQQAFALQELHVKTDSPDLRDWIGINKNPADGEPLILTRADYLRAFSGQTSSEIK